MMKKRKRDEKEVVVINSDEEKPETVVIKSDEEEDIWNVSNNFEKYSYEKPIEDSKQETNTNLNISQEDSTPKTPNAINNSKSLQKLKTPEIRYYETDLTTSPLFLVELKKSSKFSCKTCGKLTHETSQCPGNQFCDYCSQYGHFKNYCPNIGQKKCEWCQVRGHTEEKCQMKSYVLSKEDITPDVTCFCCGQKGHVNCSYPRKQSKIYFCFLCGEKGHSGISGKCKKY